MVPKWKMVTVHERNWGLRFSTPNDLLGSLRNYLLYIGTSRIKLHCPKQVDIDARSNNMRSISSVLYLHYLPKDVCSIKHFLLEIK